jgi:transcriptional regulator with XRE-family HTH domain
MVKFDGALLAEHRAQARMRQRDLGVRLGIPPHVAQQTVSRWERNAVVPETNTLPKLAALLGCRISDFCSVSPAVAEAESEAGDTAAAGAA